MVVEIKVLLSVIVIDTIIIGVLIWSNRKVTAATFAERRRQALDKIGITGILFAILLAWFSAYQLYQSFTTEQLYYGGRSSSGLEISLTDHPAIFVLLAVLYSNGFFLFGAGVLLAIVECLRAMREP